MLTIPRLLNEAAARRTGVPARLVTINPAALGPLALDPRAVNPLLLSAGALAPGGPAQITTLCDRPECGPCDTNCQQACSQFCCDSNGRNCSNRNYTRSCCGANRPNCCAGTCVSFQNDEANCGSCGRLCPAGWQCCGGACVNPATDSNNCGACGRVCPTGGVCQNGTCACPAGFPECAGRCCLPGQSCCTGETGAQCITPKDPRDGRPWCGQSRPSGADPGPVFCLNNCPPGTECGPICSGETCTVDWYCSPCPPGSIACSGLCTNPATDRNNCGACGNSCAPGQACCGGICTNLSADPLNCGSCGNTCPACCYFGGCGVTATWPDGTTGCCPTSFPTPISVPLLGNRCI